MGIKGFIKKLRSLLHFLTSLMSFNRIAPVYDILASIVFGNAIKKAQFWLLDHVPAGSSVLIAGGGTGWILQEIARKRLDCSIHFLDISEEMIRLAKKTQGDRSRYFLSAGRSMGPG
jgi:ubiquinone/menaquinone biosynthesis C-methylase UbiE